MNSLALNLPIQGWWHSWSWQVLMRHRGKVICWVLLSLICPENLLVIPLRSLKAIKNQAKKQGRKSIHFLIFASEATNNPFQVSSFLFKCHRIQPHSWHHLILIRETEAQNRGIVFPWPPGVNPGLESGSSLLRLAESWRNTTGGRFIAHFILLPPHP